jgi:hypothetical protein
MINLRVLLFISQATPILLVHYHLKPVDISMTVNLRVEWQATADASSGCKLHSNCEVSSRLDQAFPQYVNMNLVMGI